MSFDDMLDNESYVNAYENSENSDTNEICEKMLEMHSNQIFIGMVSMQYKAKIVIKIL